MTTKVKTKEQIQKLRKDYLEVSYAGRHLGYPLDTVGVWQIFGEDPNCDFGGVHHQPNLGVYEGVLSDIVDIAVALPNFWTWGGGGDIRKLDIKKPKHLNKDTVDSLVAESEACLKRIMEINQILGGLEK